MIRPLLLVVALVAALPAAARDLRVMTLNIRLPAGGDGVNRWPVRRDLTIDTIERAAPDVIGTQELFREQGRDIVQALPRYHWIGTGRRGDARDEHMGIFYRTDRLRVERWGNFWLSDTPEVPGSITWGHPYPRMVTWAIFVGAKDGARFAHFNTHLPYRAEDEAAREKGAVLLAGRIAAIAGDLPVVVTGDFNTDAAGATHRRLTTTLADAWDAARKRSGPAETFHGFTGKTDGRRIDWILTRGFAVRRVTTIDTRRGAVFPSDHYPVVAVLTSR